MEFRTTRHTLRLRNPFTISRGITRMKEVVVLRVHDDGHVGVGAAAPASYLGDSVERVERELPDLLDVARREGVNSERVERLTRDSGSPSARAAVSVALHDLAARRQGEPLYMYLGLDAPDPLPTSITIATEDVDAARRQAHRAVEEGFTALKVKLGFTGDVEHVRAVREAAPDADVRVDANAGWEPDEAAGNIRELAGYGVEFVEQPTEDLHEVYDDSVLPIAADESCVSPEEVPGVSGSADVVVVKLMKCGGVREALRSIEAARSHGLEVMMGCMIESNASLAAAAHLVGHADYADLDGSLLVEDDPYQGVPIRDGVVDLSDVERGTGAGRGKP